MGIVASAWSSSKLAFVAPHARSPVACGQGDAAVAQFTQPVADGAGAALAAAIAAGATVVSCAVVKTVAAMNALAPPLEATHVRSGAYWVYAVVRALSLGADDARSAARSGRHLHRRPVGGGDLGAHDEGVGGPWLERHPGLRARGEGVGGKRIRLRPVVDDHAARRQAWPPWSRARPATGASW